MSTIRLAALACLLLAGCHQNVVMFAGDSNTSGWNGCQYPFQWRQSENPHRWTSVNAGAMGSGAFSWIAEGRMEKNLATFNPDQVVIALGTNDVVQHHEATAVVANLWTLYQQVQAYTLPGGGHPRAYVATIPPFVRPADPGKPRPDEVVALNLQVSIANALIRARFPKNRVLDFDSWMPAEWTEGMMYWRADGIHIGCDAHAARAKIVAAAVHGD